MQKCNLKQNILVVLGLCFTGLTILGLFYFYQKKSSENIHLSSPIELDFFETAFKFNKRNFDLSNKNVFGGIIPHHLLASDMIAEFFYNLRDKDYETIVLIGPNHFDIGDFNIMTSSYEWQTPYGVLKNDKKFLKKILRIESAGMNEDIMKNEHSINAEVSFIKKTFPEAEFLPVVLKSGISRERVEELAQTIFKMQEKKKILVLASVDFSHYKDSLTAQKNDKESIETIENFDFNKIYDLDIDSPAAIYTLLRFSELNNTEFNSLNNSNSAILADKPDLESTTSYVTGYFTKPKNPEQIKMLFFGDTMLDRGILGIMNRSGLNYILGDFYDNGFLNGYDLISANLEGAVTNGGEHYLPEKKFDFAFKPEIVEELKKYNFTFFNLSNNHFFDQGEQGVEETRKNLDRLGFDYSGCEGSIISDCAIKIISINNKKVAMTGLSVFWDEFDLENAKEKISELKDKVDFIVINIHWGEEYSTYVDDYQKNIAHSLIDSGADAIIGHHPHVIQEVEVYRGKPIFYSLGNFIFDQYFREDVQRGLAAELILENDEVKFYPHPFISEKNKIISVERERD